MDCREVIAKLAPASLARSPCFHYCVKKKMVVHGPTPDLLRPGLGLQRPPEVVEVLGKAAVVEILDEARMRRTFRPQQKAAGMV